MSGNMALVCYICIVAGLFLACTVAWLIGPSDHATHHTEPVTSAPEPTALVDPALTSDTPARAQLSEPAPAALSASDQADDSPSLPEAQGQVSLLMLGGDLGDWVQKYVKDHPNGPWIKIPEGAKEVELHAFAVQMKQIIEEQDEKNARLLEDYGNDLIAFSKDPRARQNDRDKQFRLRSAFSSIWQEVKWPD